MFLGKIVGNVVRKSKFFLLNNKSELYLIGGGVLIIAGNVVNCYQSTKLNEVLERHREGCEDVHEDADAGIITEKEEKASITHQYMRTGMAFAKLYGPGVLLNIAGFVLVGKSHSIMKSRNEALLAAYSAVSTAYSNYRDKVIAKYGEEEDAVIKYGLIKKEGEETIVDEQGREITEVKTQNYIDPKATMASPYTYVISASPNNFDEGTSPLYLKNDLIAMQNDFNDIFRREGYVFLNDILRKLERPGDPNSIHPNDDGQIVGWKWDSAGDNYIDFGIFTAKNYEFLNGNSEVCILDFNCQGPILGTNCFRKSK